VLFNLPKSNRISFREFSFGGMMDEKLIESIMVRMEAKGTEELQGILKKNDAAEWTAEAFEAVRRVLTARKESAPAVGNEPAPADDVELLHFKSVGIISQYHSGIMRVTQYDMNDVHKHAIPEVPSRIGRYAAIGTVIALPAVLVLVLLTHAATTAENLGAGFLFFAVVGAIAGGAVGRATNRGIETRKMREAAGRERVMLGARLKDFAVIREEDWEEFLLALKK